MKIVIEEFGSETRVHAESETEAYVQLKNGRVYQGIVKAVVVEKGWPDRRGTAVDAKEDVAIARAIEDMMKNRKDKIA